MSRGKVKVRHRMHRDGRNVIRIQYTSWAIVKKCPERKLDMYFCKMDEYGPHFIFMPAFAMQFQSEQDALDVMKKYSIKKCRVEEIYEVENSNVHNSYKNLAKHTIINP